MPLQVQTQHNRGETNAHSTLFVRSGAIGLYYGSLRASGYNSQNWSGTAADYSTGTWANRAFFLYFDPPAVSTSGNNARWHGFPVRCLVYKLTGRSKYLRSRSSGRTRRFSAPALQRQALATRAEYLRYLLLHY